MKRTNKSLFITAMAVVSLAAVTNAQPVTISALDVRSNGIFGSAADTYPVYGNHMVNASGVTINGVPPVDQTPIVVDPINVELTYSNLDLDGDTTANDAVTFTLTAQKIGMDGGDLRIFGQGIDSGFGQINDVQVSVTSVSGTTTDSGDTIVFDGFVGANVGAGASAAIDRSVEVNGTTITLVSPDMGGFHFITDGIDFAPTATVVFDNSGGSAGPGSPGLGSVVARSYDLQFSATDMPMLGCDLNGDTFCDTVDVDLLVADIANGTGLFDVDGSGTVDVDDLTEWLSLAGAENLASGNSYLVGDANLDGGVDGQDFVLWNTNKFTSVAAWSAGDFNADGVVNGQDFVLWNGNKFMSADPAAVPEPSSLLLLGLSGLALCRLRWSRR